MTVSIAEELTAAGRQNDTKTSLQTPSKLFENVQSTYLILISKGRTKRKPGVGVRGVYTRVSTRVSGPTQKKGQETASPTNTASANPIDRVRTQGRIHVKDAGFNFLHKLNEVSQLLLASQVDCRIPKIDCLLRIFQIAYIQLQVLKKLHTICFPTLSFMACNLVKLETTISHGDLGIISSSTWMQLVLSN